MTITACIDEKPAQVLPAETPPADHTRSANHWLMSSPYSEPEHLLDLTTLDTPNRLLALALQSLAPITPTYATTAYESALNWPTVMSRLHTLTRAANHPWKTSTFYVVEFRSTLHPSIDAPFLFSLDKHSHAEAVAAGGLLKYWYGSPDASRRNLATCLWRGEDDAKRGGSGPWHRKARGVIVQMYERIVVSGLRLKILDDVAGWEFETIA